LKREPIGGASGLLKSSRGVYLKVNAIDFTPQVPHNKLNSSAERIYAADYMIPHRIPVEKQWVEDQ
jgi:hypothetical protein